MPRTAIYTPEEIKQRRYIKNKEYIKNRCENDPEYRQKQCEYVKKSVAKKKAEQEEELNKLRQFYDNYKNVVGEQ
jgi:hypothetical protein